MKLKNFLWLPAIGIAFGGRPKFKIVQWLDKKVWFASFGFLHLMICLDKNYVDICTGD